MTHVPMLDNILGQAASLRRVLDHSAGEGQRALREAGKAIRECLGRVVVTGMGASFFASLPAVQALQAHGCKVIYAESAELLHFGGMTWGADDVAILISRSGGSIETVELALKFATLGARTISVTNVPGSRLTTTSVTSLSVNSAPDHLIAVQTYTGTVVAMLLLAEEAIRPGSVELSQRCGEMLPALDAHVALSLERSELWREFFLGRGPLYLLGRGGALAGLHEGALLFHETAKVPVIAMSSGQFRHGPVEVVSAEFRALVLGTPYATTLLDWQLAKDLRSMRGEVRWLGGEPVEGEMNDMLLVPWPKEIAAELMPLFDVVPLQVAAYRTALWRGIRPGDFLYASEVTEKEAGFPLFEASLS